MPPPKKKNKNAPSMLLNEKVPLPHRRMLLADICNNDSDEAAEMLDALFKAAARSNGGEDQYKEKTKEVDQLMDALVNGPQRPGTFINTLRPKGAQPTRALVKLADGTPAYPVVPDAELAKNLRRGDSVLLSTFLNLALCKDTVLNAVTYTLAMALIWVIKFRAYPLAA